MPVNTDRTLDVQGTRDAHKAAEIHLDSDGQPTPAPTASLSDGTDTATSVPSTPSRSTPAPSAEPRLADDPTTFSITDLPAMADLAEISHRADRAGLNQFGEYADIAETANLTQYGDFTGLRAHVRTAIKNGQQDSLRPHPHRLGALPPETSARALLGYLLDLRLGTKVTD